MTKRKSKIKGQKLSSAQLKNEIVKLLRRQPKKRLSAKQIIKKLKIANNKDSVIYALNQLAETDQIRIVDGFKYTLSNKVLSDSFQKLADGRVDITRFGSAYIVCEDLADDVYISSKHINGAYHGDRVRVSIFRSKFKRRPEGEIVKVLERASEYFLGELRITQKYGIVSPDRHNMNTEIFVELDELNGAQEGDKVVVKIIKWPTKVNFSPIGVITSVLGAVGSNDIEMKSILLSHGFNLDFDPAAIAEAEALPVQIDQQEIESRRDMRQKVTFTIDPQDAKDFDDALSLHYLENGNCEVGVHIADVTHYVKPDTALDKAAYRQSTSVYLVDRVLPMLPEKLSNELCSLRPNEDKRTFSTVFEFDKSGKIVSQWFGKTLIHSDRRFTYEEAQEVLEQGAGDFAKELKQLDKLAKILRKEKFRKGAIAFEADEVSFKLDESGKPVDVYIKKRKDAHLLIEDFMLLANRAVATYVSKKRVPFIYRIHDLPNPEKIADFARFALELGFKMDVQSPKLIAQSFNSLAKAARNNDLLKMLEPIAIRTMAKAEYSTENIGHYGLAFTNYTHFTSPIRRYSDVLAHRILGKNLDGTFRDNKELLEERCRRISSQERKALDAERESIKYKQVEFIKEFIGEVFDGNITGIIDRGMFVALNESRCEGMVGFESLNEAFEIEEGRLRARGLRTGRQYKMGDQVKVKIIDADLSKRQIDMALVE